MMTPDPDEVMVVALVVAALFAVVYDRASLRRRRARARERWKGRR